MRYAVNFMILMWGHLYLWFTRNDLEAAEERKRQLEYELVVLAPRAIERAKARRSEVEVQIMVARHSFRRSR